MKIVILGKNGDSTAIVYNRLAKEYLDICVDWIKSGKHNGFKAQSEIITMQ